MQTARKQLPVYAGHNIVGSIEGNQFFKSGEIFAKYNAWALEPGTISQLKYRNVLHLVFKDKTTKLSYRISFKDFLEKGFLKKESWGERYFCEIDNFKVSGHEQLRLLG